MKLILRIVGDKKQITETLEELAKEFSRHYIDNNARTSHENGAESDYDITDGTTIEDSPDEKTIQVVV